MLNNGGGFVVKFQAERKNVVACGEKKESCGTAILELNSLAVFNHYRPWCTKISPSTIGSFNNHHDYGDKNVTNLHTQRAKQ